MSQGASERRGILWRWRGPSGLRWVWLGGIGGRRRRGQESMRWLDGITNSMYMSLQRGNKDFSQIIVPVKYRPCPPSFIHLRRPPAPCPPAHPSEACGLHCPLSTHRPGGHTIVHVALPGSYPFRTENKQSQREAHNAPAGHREKRHRCPLLSMVLRWTCHPGPQLRGRSVQRVLQCPPAA